MMRELLENIKDFAKVVMETLHGLWKLRIFRYFLLLLISLIFCTIFYAIKFQGMTMEDFGLPGIDITKIGFDEFLYKFTHYEQSAAAAHRDTQEIIKRFFEATGKVPFGYTV